MAGREAVHERMTPGGEPVVAMPGLQTHVAPAVSGRWAQDARRRRFLALADFFAGSISALIATVSIAGLWGLMLAPALLITAKLFGLYDRDHRALRHLTADEIPAILGSAGVATAAIALMLTWTPGGSIGLYHTVGLFLITSFLMITFRSITRSLWWKRTPPERVGVVGDGSAMESLQRKFQLFGEMHLELVAVRDIGDLGEGKHRQHELRSLVSEVDRIVVAATGVEAELIGFLKDVCGRQQVKISVVSPLRGKALPSERFVQLADLPILEYNTWDASRSTLLIKRLFDVVVATVGLILFAPVALVVAICIKLDSPGPILFSQIRAGLDGRPIRMYKFRTMTVDAEAKLDGLIDLRELDEPAFKLKDDPRITRVGGFLRRLSIDEVPQLINVVVGEMSIVGPRPEQVELVERYSEAERIRLSVKPGVTGPMQVFGRGELTFAERLAVEIQYIENPSLGQDLRILIHTLPAVMRGTGAF